jgi:hypothetical protein
MLLAVIVCSVLSSVTAGAAEPSTAEAPEATAQILLDTVRANRKALVAVNLALSAEEAGKFWPLYDRYRKELDVIGDRVEVIIGDYAKSFSDLSDEKALRLMEDYLAAEAERTQVRHAYLPQFAKFLPGRTVARFYQIENKMDAVLRYDRAATIPVIDEEPVAAPK